MEITEEFLSAGMSERGGFSRQQLELLGISWPPSQGWKRALLGQSISDEVAGAFLALANQHARKKGGSEGTSAPKAVPKGPVNWCGAPDPVDIFLYVLALENGCFYVGLTSDLSRRMAQHFSGEGSDWTQLHPPVRILHTISTGTQDGREAERLEDEVTISLILRHGLDKVRGGHFAYADQMRVEDQLRSRGIWERIKLTELDRQFVDTEARWSDALDHFLDVALRFYDAGGPKAQQDEVFAACYRLTRYRYWHEDFTPGLNWGFWNRKGILPVLLSFKLGRPVGSGLATSYDVLAAAMTRGKSGQHPLRRLFLLVWQAYQPPVTDNQVTATKRFMAYLESGDAFDRQYDAWVSILLPETRHLLRV